MDERKEQLEQLTTETLERLADQLSQGHSEQFKDLLRFHAQFVKYSLRNTLLIKEQCPRATRVAAYGLWQKLGFQVAQGQRGIFIFAPLLKKEVRDGETVQVLTGYKPVAVFDASQLTEESKQRLPQLHQPLPDDCYPVYAALLANLTARNFRVEETELPPGVHGSCQPDGRIRLETMLDSRNKILVLAHEVCHWAAHFGRQAEGLTTADMEFQAEATAVVIGAMFGIESPTAADYILSWHGDAEKLRSELQTIHGLVKRVCDLLKIEEVLTEAHEAAA